MRFRLLEDYSKYDDKNKLYSALPKYVYHATLKDYLNTIVETGLKDAWIGCDIDECIEYARRAHKCSYDDIVVLEIPKKVLDPNRCHFEDDVGDGFSDEWSWTFIYNGVVDVSAFDSYWVDEGKWYYIKEEGNLK